MFLLRFFRFLTGYVIFEGKGGFPERFLNLCALNSINVWDAKCISGTFSAKTNISCYKKIRPCAKRSGIRFRAVRKYGLPFLIKPYAQRKGLLAGAVLSLIIISLLSSCIWTIEVTGNEKYTRQQIVQIARQYGITTGTFRNSVDAKAVRENIKSSVDGINWFSVNVDNTAVTLEVLENTGSNEILDLTTPCNITSTTDGELIKLEVYTGQAALKTGNAVTVGDLLISGVVERADGSSDFVHARGNAVVRTKKEISQTVSFSQKRYKLQTDGKDYILSLFSLKIPLTVPNDSDVSRTESSYLKYENRILPAGMITTDRFSYLSENVTITKQQATLLCEYAVFTKEAIIMKNSQTESKNFKITETNNGITARISYINHEKSGIENYFIVDTD